MQSPGDKTNWGQWHKSQGRFPRDELQQAQAEVEPPRVKLVHPHERFTTDRTAHTFWNPKLRHLQMRGLGHADLPNPPHPGNYENWVEEVKMRRGPPYELLWDRRRNDTDPPISLTSAQETRRKELEKTVYKAKDKLEIAEGILVYAQQTVRDRERLRREAMDEDLKDHSVRRLMEQHARMERQEHALVWKNWRIVFNEFKETAEQIFEWADAWAKVEELDEKFIATVTGAMQSFFVEHNQAERALWDFLAPLQTAANEAAAAAAARARQTALQSRIDTRVQTGRAPMGPRPQGTSSNTNPPPPSPTKANRRHGWQ